MRPSDYAAKSLLRASRLSSVITVAIPTLGRPAHALEALRSVVAQVCETPSEVLVLDNGCDPDLAESVRQVARDAPKSVSYVPVPQVGLHNARHEAARRARGDIVAYLDDDVVVQEGWLAALAGSFSDPTVHLVGGRCLPLYEAGPPPWLEAFSARNDDGWWCVVLSLIDLGPEAKLVDPRFVFGANFAIRIETLIRAGGFHPDALPWRLRRFRGDGETAVAAAVQELGLRAAYNPAATVLHKVPAERLTEQYVQRRFFLEGVSDSFSASRASGGRLVAHPRPQPAKWSLQRLRSLLAGNVQEASTSGEWAEVHKLAREAREAGYVFHQQQLASDPALRAWVLAGDYWEKEVPDSECGSS